MARMHTRRKGKSSSLKPDIKKSPEWVSYKPGEVEKLVTKLGSKGVQSSNIGRELRDVYGVPDVKVITGKNISRLLKDSKNYGEIPEDLFNLLQRAVKVKKHLESNKKDLHSDHGFRMLESKIKRLVKYYKSRNVLDKAWAYNIETAKILIE